MKFKILTSLKEKPWGGGNQFLKALKFSLVNKGVYSEDINNSDCLIVNSHHFDFKVWHLYKLKKSKPSIRIIHRIDGPMSSVRGKRINILLDYVINSFNKNFADGTVFQSNWTSKNSKSKKLFLSNPIKVIHNAPDSRFFYKNKASIVGHKTKIMSTSWSTNLKKGFDILSYLDQNLDYSKFEFYFVGNSPIKFKKIKHIEPLPSKELANLLREGHIYFSGSQIESCSNSLLEGMHCGLVPVAMNNSSHPELVRNQDLIYQSTKDVIKVIENIASNLEKYKKEINPDSIEKISDEYIKFARKIAKDYPKKFTFLNFLKFTIFLKLVYFFINSVERLSKFKS